MSNDRQMEPEIYKLIPAIMKDVGVVGKAGKNEKQGYKFRRIDDVMAAAQPAFMIHGVFCAPCVMKREEYRFEKTNDRGIVTTWLHVTLEVKHTFYAHDGSSVPVITCGEGLDNSDKATNKAMSQAYKYAIVELLCIPTVDMAEPDLDSPEQGTRRFVSRTTEDIPITRNSAPIQTKQNNPNGSDSSGKGEAIPNGGAESHFTAAAQVVPTVICPDCSGSKKEKYGDGFRTCYRCDGSGILRETTTLPPVESTLVKQAEANVSPKLGMFPADHIEDGQAANFERMFKDALNPQLRKRATELSHAWLKKKDIVDSNGEPTAKAILKQNFYEVREQAILYAKELMI